MLAGVDMRVACPQHERDQAAGRELDRTLMHVALGVRARDGTSSQVSASFLTVACFAQIFIVYHFFCAIVFYQKERSRSRVRQV